PVSFQSRLPAGSWSILLGVVPLIVVAAAAPRAVGLERRLLLVTAGLGAVALTQHQGLPVAKVFGSLPGLRMINGTYWASLVGAGLTLAVGVAVGVWVTRGVSVRAGLTTAGVLAAVVLVAVALLGRATGRVGAENAGPAISLALIIAA